MSIIYGFQEPVTPIMEGIIDLHNFIFFPLICIMSLVSWILFAILINFYYELIYNFITRLYILQCTKIIHGTIIELVWTITPSLILILIAIPSFTLLYTIESVFIFDMTCKIIGHQWYWQYEISI